MPAVDPQITASELLRTFHRDEPYLFLGAAFTTVAILAAAFAFLRRKVDSLAVYFALFAFLYGQRLWVQAGLLETLIPPSQLFERLRSGIDFLVPIPAFLFFDAAGLLHRRGKVLGYVLGILLGSLAVATFAFGPSHSYHVINDVVVIAALVLLVIQSLLNRDRNRDFVVVRRGLLIFVAFALWDNVVGAFGRASKIEPYGFVAFLAALGYVAARQILEWGPRVVVAKQGEYGAALYTAESVFALPAYPLETVVDPTGAGDSFAGGFLGYLDAHPRDLDDQTLRRAMTYGSVLASFNVEEFGTERVRRLTTDEINRRFDEFREMTHVETLPVEQDVFQS